MQTINAERQSHPSRLQRKISHRYITVKLYENTSAYIYIYLPTAPVKSITFYRWVNISSTFLLVQTNDDMSERLLTVKLYGNYGISVGCGGMEGEERKGFRFIIIFLSICFSRVYGGSDRFVFIALFLWPFARCRGVRVREECNENKAPGTWIIFKS